MILQELIWNEINKYRNRGINLFEAVERSDPEMKQFMADVFETNDAMIQALTAIAGEEPEIPEEMEDGDDI